MVVLQRRSPSISLGTLEVQAPVPTYFVCPISLDLMLDPVTLTSGQTFDRTSIEKWLDDGHRTCPVTRLPIDADEDLIPNHVLRRLIQAWCEENENLGIQRIVTPRQPLCTARDIPVLLDQVTDDGYNNGLFGSKIGVVGYETSSYKVDTLDALRRLNSAVVSRPGLRRFFMQAGAIARLGCLLSRSIATMTTMPGSIQTLVCMDSSSNSAMASSLAIGKIEETLRLLTTLMTSEEMPAMEPNSSSLPMTSWRCDPGHEDEVAYTLASMVTAKWRPSSIETKYNAAFVLSRMKVSDLGKRQNVISQVEGFIPSLVDMIREGSVVVQQPMVSGSVSGHMAQKHAHLAMKLLLIVVQPLTGKADRNTRGARGAAVAAGAIDAIAESLEINNKNMFVPDHARSKKTGIELGLRVVEILCRSGEGRASALACPRLLGILVDGMGSSGFSAAVTKLSIRILSLMLLKQSSPSELHDLMIQTSVELGVFSKAMNVASRFPPSSKTRIAALKIAKSLSHFVPSFLL